MLVGLVRLLVGAYPRWQSEPVPESQRLFFANHTSHIDTLAIWSALPEPVRARTRPVAGRDYWDHAGVRRYVALSLLRAVLIERVREQRSGDPLAPLRDALRQGDSLILFPEGTRGAEHLPGAFRAGLFHLAQEFPQVELVPVYLENLNRAMPKGAWLPVPLTCTVRFGMPLARQADEGRDAFLERARAAVVALS